MNDIIHMPRPQTEAWVSSMEPGGFFDQWHGACRARFERTAPAEPSDFAAKGFEKLKFLSANAAADIKRRLQRNAADPANIVSTDDFQDTVVERDDRFIYDFLDQVIGPDLETRVTEFFRSEFCVFWLQFARVRPTPVATTSFQWHRDGGPGAFAIALVYLDASSEHGANTEFIDTGATEKMAAAGYAFPDVAERVDDLSDVAARAGIDYAPFYTDIAAGEGVLFRAHDALHRGVLPTRGTRHGVFLNLVPSCRHWRDGLSHWTPEHMRAVNGNWTLDHIPMLAGRDGPLVMT